MVAYSSSVAKLIMLSSLPPLTPAANFIPVPPNLRLEKNARKSNNFYTYYCLNFFVSNVFELWVQLIFESKVGGLIHEKGFIYE